MFRPDPMLRSEIGKLVVPPLAKLLDRSLLRSAQR
jgi:hypothetical protein